MLKKLKQLKSKPHHINMTKISGRPYTKISGAVFVLVFAAIGVHLLFSSYAETPGKSSTILPAMALESNVITPTQVAINWAASSSSGITGYSVLRNGTQVATTDAYETNYLDTGLSPSTNYSYSVVALQGTTSGPQSSPLSVTTTATANEQVISGCNGQTLSGGNYILTASLVNNNTNEDLPEIPCFKIDANTSPVSVDCQGNSITTPPGASTAVESDNSVNGYLFVNCKFIDQYPSSSTGENVQCNNSSSGIFEDDTISSSAGTNGLGLNQCSNTIISHNSFVNSYFGGGGTYNYFGFNSMTDPSHLALSPQVVDFWGGSNNVIDNNTIDGGATFPSGSSKEGTDDGIGLGNNVTTPETNDTVVNNNISNVWDTGIETIGLIDNTTFANNTIYNAWKFGIGGWYWSSFENNTLTGNKVSNSASMFNFTNSGGPPVGQSTIYFQNNTFANNVFTQSNDEYPIWGTFIDATQEGSAPVISGNNTFTNNNFGFVDRAPAIAPSSDLVNGNVVNEVNDGGGNICSTNNEPSPELLKCNNPSTDTTPPTLSITSPTSGTSVSGASYPVTVSASDSAGITGVYFYIDSDTSSPSCYSTSAPYSCTINVTDYSDGAHTLYVIAYDTAGNQTTQSIPINITGNVTTIDPSTPTNFQASFTSSANTEISASWDASTPGTNPIAKYEVFDCSYENGACVGFEALAATFPATATSGTFAPTEVNVETDFEFYVYAVDSQGNASGASNGVFLDIYPSNTNPPTTPTNVTATANSYNNVTVNWGASTDGGGTLGGYYIMRSTNSGAYTTIGQVSSSTTNYSDTSVSASTSYSYIIQAFDEDGTTSPESVSSPTITTPSGPGSNTPTAPTNVTAKAVSSSQINLSWSASTDNVGIKNYSIYRTTGGSSPTLIGTSITTGYGDTDLSPSTNYNYYIVATGNDGNISVDSSTVTAETQASPHTVTLQGVVTSSSTDQPLNNVLINAAIKSIGGNVATTYTNSSGQYVITNLTPSIKYSYTFSDSGYKTLTYNHGFKAGIHNHNISLK